MISEGKGFDGHDNNLDALKCFHMWSSDFNYIISCGIGIKSTTIIASDWLHFQFVLLNDVHCVHEVLLTRISAEKVHVCRNCYETGCELAVAVILWFEEHIVRSFVTIQWTICCGLHDWNLWSGNDWSMGSRIFLVEVR